jgi:uncharacterized protein (TIGR03435 family)
MVLWREGFKMMQWIAVAAVLLARGAYAQTTPQRPTFEAFEVATVKPAIEDQKGRYLKMEGAGRFIGKDYTLKLLIAAAYDLNPKTISGGPPWVDSSHFDIAARTPGQVLPTHDEQMKMLRSLLTERFHLAFHREQREFSFYALELAKGGARLKPSVTPEQPPTVGPGVVYPGRIALPGHNATVQELASLLQRAILDRPVVDRTGLTGRYDFSLEWAPNETEFGGDVGAAPETTPSLPLFEAIQQQLGLRLEPTRGPVDALAIDAAQKPTDN